VLSARKVTKVQPERKVQLAHKVRKGFRVKPVRRGIKAFREPKVIKA
jgi:hypothetical protein